jgi:hypothetical protein
MHKERDNDRAMVDKCQSAAAWCCFILLLLTLLAGAVFALAVRIQLQANYSYENESACVSKENCAWCSSPPKCLYAACTIDGTYDPVEDSTCDRWPWYVLHERSPSTVHGAMFV